MTTRGKGSSQSGKDERSTIARPSAGPILRALRQAHGSKGRAAILLHVSPRIFQARIQELGLPARVEKLKSDIRTGDAEAVLAVMHRASGSFSRAALMLNITVRQLRYLIAALELTDDVRRYRGQLARTRAELEKQRILDAIKQANCNLTVAARLLGMKYARMYSRVLAFGLSNEIAQLRMAKDEQCAEKLRNALVQMHWNRKDAAAALGIQYTTFCRLTKKLGIVDAPRPVSQN